MLVSIKQRCQRRVEKRSGDTPFSPVITTGQRIYRAVCTADEPDVAEVACPHQLGSIWSLLRPNLLAISLSTEEVEDAGPGRVYDVTVDFSDENQASGEEPEQPGVTPNLQIAWGFETFTEDAALSEEAPKDYITSAGDVQELSAWKWKRAIVNSAGMPFNPSVSKTYFDRAVVMERDTLNYNPNVADDFIDSINSKRLGIRYRNVTYGIQKETAWLRDWSATPQFANGVEYWHERLEMVIRRDGWLRNIADRGLMEISSDDGDSVRRRPILDANGDPVTEEVPLDASGGKLTGSSNPIYYIRFPLNKKRDFAQMNIRE